MRERVFQVLSIRLGLLATLIQLLPQAQLQFTGCFVSECDRHNPVDRGQPCLQHVYDTADEFRSLAGTRRCFDKQTLGERLANATPCGTIVGWCCAWKHWFKTACSRSAVSHKHELHDKFLQPEFNSRMLYRVFTALTLA